MRRLTIAHLICYGAMIFMVTVSKHPTNKYPDVGEIKASFLMERDEEGPFFSVTNQSDRVVTVAIVDADQPPMTSAREFGEYFQNKYENLKDRAEAIYQYFVEHSFDHLAHEEPSNHKPHNPVVLLDSYGYGACDDSALALEYAWIASGLEARVHWLQGHVVPEVYYENGWHVYDPNLKLVVRGEDGTALSRSDITSSINRLDNAYRKQYGQSNDSLIRAYLDTHGESVTTSVFHNKSYSMDLVLKKGEKYTRFKRKMSASPLTATPGARPIHSTAKLTFADDINFYGQTRVLPFGGAHVFLEGKLSFTTHNTNVFIKSIDDTEWHHIKPDQTNEIRDYIRGSAYFEIKLQPKILFRPSNVSLSTDLTLQVGHSTFPRNPRIQRLTHSEFFFQQLRNRYKEADPSTISIVR